MKIILKNVTSFIHLTFIGFHFLHIDCVQSGSSVLPQTISPVIWMNPEVVKRAAEDPELFSVQREPVPLIRGKSGVDVSVVGEVLVDRLKLRNLGHVAADGVIGRIENLK